MLNILVIISDGLMVLFAKDVQKKRVVSMELIIAIALLGILAIIPILTKRRSIKRKLRKDSEKDFDNRINEEVRSGG